MLTLWIHSVSMSLTATEPKRPLGVRVTADQHRVIAEAAKLEHRSINSFVVEAAMKKAAGSAHGEASRHVEL